MTYAGMHQYNDVIMTTIASQITSLVVVYSIVYSDADETKHQSSASLAFVRGINRDRWIPRTKGQLRGKCFRLMTSSCITRIAWRSHCLKSLTSCTFLTNSLKHFMVWCSTQDTLCTLISEHTAYLVMHTKSSVSSSPWRFADFGQI